MSAVSQITKIDVNYYRFDKVMYSRDLTTIDLTKSCICATYHKSHHYFALMTAKEQTYGGMQYILQISSVFIPKGCHYSVKKWKLVVFLLNE